MGVPIESTTHELAVWIQEHIAKGKTSEALATLMKLAPQEATVVTLENGIIQTTQVMNIGLIERGDIVQVKPGEKMPVDGRVMDGKSSADEAFITGEAIMIDDTTWLAVKDQLTTVAATA